MLKLKISSIEMIELIMENLKQNYNEFFIRGAVEKNSFMNVIVIMKMEENELK